MKKFLLTICNKNVYNFSYLLCYDEFSKRLTKPNKIEGQSKRFNGLNIPKFADY